MLSEAMVSAAATGWSPVRNIMSSGEKLTYSILLLSLSRISEEKKNLLNNGMFYKLFL